MDEVKEGPEEMNKLILQAVHKQKPQNTKQLITLLQNHYGLSVETIYNHLIKLENEGRLQFIHHKSSRYDLASGYFLSQEAFWYWAIIVFSIFTAIIVFLIPYSNSPLVYLRYIFGVPFVLFSPGYSFLKILYPKTPIKTDFLLTREKQKTSNIDLIDRFALSIATSMIFISIVGLALNYTPWGLSLISVNISLLLLSVIFSTMGALRQYFLWELQKGNE